MNYKKDNLRDMHNQPKKNYSVSSYGKWYADGIFIIDTLGNKVALMNGDAAEHEWHQRRIVAVLNALRDIPTQFIEELLEKCDDNIIQTLITRHRDAVATIHQLKEKIMVHSREIEQLRATIEACQAFEEQRALLKQGPGANEYNQLLRTLGLR